MIFSHWQMVSGEAYETGSQCEKLVLQVRARKGLKAELPSWTDFYDKL